jgi:hypothetical protein
MTATSFAGLGKIKENRRLAVRYEKSDLNFLSFIMVACGGSRLRLLLYLALAFGAGALCAGLFLSGRRSFSVGDLDRRYGVKPLRGFATEFHLGGAWSGCGETPCL